MRQHGKAEEVSIAQPRFPHNVCIRPTIDTASVATSYPPLGHALRHPCSGSLFATLQHTSCFTVRYLSYTLYNFDLCTANFLRPTYFFTVYIHYTPKWVLCQAFGLCLWCQGRVSAPTIWCILHQWAASLKLLNVPCLLYILIPFGDSP